MKSQTKKILKLSGIILGALTAVAGILIAVVLNFIFTSEKLTPIVLEAANRNLNAKLDMKSVELTFFSTFPRFGVQLTDGTLVSKAIRDTLWQRTDTLVSFKKAVAVVNPMDYLRQQKISIHRLALEHADIYAYKNKDGIANWDITVPDTVQSASSPAGDAMNISELDIRQISIQHATVTMDDRDTRIFANLWDTNLTLKANMKKGHSMLAVDFRNKNLLFWQYGLHTPSLETVLHMIPESILKKAEVSAGGEVSFIGTLKGMYGKQKMPLATLDIRIKDAFARYAGLPYGIDKVNADFSARIDLMRNTPSCLNLKIFQFKGADTDILADMKVDNLLTDPDITFHTRSTVDLNTLAQIFPLQEGIGMDGKMNADLKLRCRLSTLKKQDWGRVKMQGKIRTDKLVLRHTQKNFEFTSNATLDFAGNEWLGGRVEIKDMTLRSPALNSATESFTAAISTYPSQDTLRPAKTECKIEMNKLRISLADSLDLFCGKSSARLKLQPGEHNPANPQIGLTLEVDTLFCRMGDTRLGMDKAGIGITAEKVRDSLWTPKGIIGFHRMAFRTPECALPIQVQKTSVTVNDRVITLRNATMRIGKSDITATGSIHDLYGAMRHHKLLRAKLDLSSEQLDCNQLIRSISLPSDTLAAESDTVSTEVKLFVIPKNLDFELQTDFRKVYYEKVTFNNVRGAVDIRNQSVYLKQLSMKGMGSDMNTTLVYQAKSPEEGFAGFDFRLHNINIGKLVDFAPSLDTIVPMLRSFEGTVDFNVAAAASLDSALNIKIPTMRSAIHVKGDSLVLMDGETFAEISKKFFFKNKKRNMIDSISVNIGIKDGNVTVYPFEISMDRYRAAVGGTQGLDMKFDYHISILKSPIPFKLGLNISGTLDDMKFKLVKARYKDAVTPAEVHKVDSAIVNMGQQIAEDFKKIMKR